MKNQQLTFVCAVNDPEVYEENFLNSDIFHKNHCHTIIPKFGYSSPGIPYNEALKDSPNDLVIFAHQDVYFPDNWDLQLLQILSQLDEAGEKWGALGCYGIRPNGLPCGYLYSNGINKILGKDITFGEVNSLDEFVIILKKSNGIFFDERLPNFHLYGTDICLASKHRGLKNFAVGNFCIHNSIAIHQLPNDFWQCANYLRKKHKLHLPIKTTCAEIHPTMPMFIFQILWSRLKSSIFHDKRRNNIRNPDVRALHRNLFSS